MTKLLKKCRFRIFSPFWTLIILYYSQWGFQNRFNFLCNQALKKSTSVGWCKFTPAMQNVKQEGMHKPGLRGAGGIQV